MPTQKGDKVWWRVPRDWTRLKMAVYAKAVVAKDADGDVVVIHYREPREGQTPVKRYQRVAVGELSARLESEPLTAIPDGPQQETESFDKDSVSQKNHS